MEKDNEAVVEIINAILYLQAKRLEDARIEIEKLIKSKYGKH